MSLNGTVNTAKQTGKYIKQNLGKQSYTKIKIGFLSILTWKGLSIFFQNIYQLQFPSFNLRYGFEIKEK